MVHVPYHGASAALADLIGGQVQVMFAAVTSSIEYCRFRSIADSHSGALRTAFR
jgi:tripartite-type tricarboxylate transporter receptor subunit TctC